MKYNNFLCETLVINRRLLNILGCEKAVYLSALIDIHKHNESPYIPLDREDIQYYTGIIPNRQKDIEKALIENGLIQVEEEHVFTYYRINIENILNLFKGE